MSSINSVTCPNCKHPFKLESAIASDIEKDIREKLNTQVATWKADQLAKLDAETKQKEAALANKLQQMQLENEASLKIQRAAIQEQIKKNLQAENDATIASLKKENEAQNQLVRGLKEKEILFMEKEKSLKNQTEALELEMKRRALEMEVTLAEKIQKEESQKNELRFKEYEKQLEDQKKLVEEMRRKSQQGSMQLQGEVQELAIEEWIKSKFPFDKLEEIKKGIRGADCVQTVVNQLGVECGKIYYESKRTKDFQPAWIDKFKEDLRENGAEIGVLVTQTMPKDLDHFAQKEGVWVCTFEDFKALSYVLRDSILRVHQVAIAQVGKVEKTALLYDYLTSNSFRMNIEAIVEGLYNLKADLEKEKNAMQRIWKSREKQMEKVIFSTIDLYGSVKGIAGSSIGEVKMLELGGDLFLEEELD